MAGIEMAGLRKTYPGNAADTLKSIDLRVEDGKLAVLVAPRAAASPRCCG